MMAFRKSLGTGLGIVLLGAGSIVAAHSADRFNARYRERPSEVVLSQTEGVLGKSLISASGENVGRIVDVLADETGRVQAAVVDFGGFLGVGSRKIAVAWSDLRFGENGSGAVWVDMPQKRLSEAPEVKAGMPVVVVSSHDPAGKRAENQNQ